MLFIGLEKGWIWFGDIGLGMWYEVLGVDPLLGSEPRIPAQAQAQPRRHGALRAPLSPKKPTI